MILGRGKPSLFCKRCSGIVKQHQAFGHESKLFGGAVFDGRPIENFYRVDGLQIG